MVGGLRAAIYSFCSHEVYNMAEYEDIDGGQSLQSLTRKHARGNTAQTARARVGGPSEDQLRAYMIGIARSEASALRDSSGGQNLTKEVFREALEVGDISPSDDEPSSEEEPLTKQAFESVLEKFLTPLRKKISMQSLLSLTDETPHVRTVHYTFDSRYCRSLSGGTMSFLLSTAGPTEGAYSQKEAENVFEIRVGELSLPTDIPWGDAAEQTNRSEITLLFNEAARWAYHDAENAHHFRGYADSSDVAAYLYYFGNTPANISAAIASNQSALVRWYERSFVFDEPFSFRGEASLTWRRSGVEIPFYACVYTVSIAFTATSSTASVTFADSVSVANADAMLSGDTVFFESAVGDGSSLTLTKGTGYSVNGVAGGTRTFDIDAVSVAGATTTVSGVSMVVPKWRMRADVTMRCLTTSQSNFTHP